jgi:integrase/recombinase XerD
MRLMGHKSVSTTAIYVDANDDMLRKAVELI